MVARTPQRKKHRIVTLRMVVASVVVGVVLAVGSVPYGTLVAELRLRGPLSKWVGDRLPGPTRSMGVSWVVTGNPQWPEYLAEVPLFLDSFGSFPSFEHVTEGIVPDAAVRAAKREGDWLDVYWSGFPFRAAVGWWSFPGPSENLIRWQDQSRYGHPRAIAIPLRPIWPGLLGNTLSYAAIVLVLLVGLRFHRTRRRRRRGWCVGCGYELGEGVGVCPECGLAMSHVLNEPLV